MKNILLWILVTFLALSIALALDFGLQIKKLKSTVEGLKSQVKMAQMWSKNLQEENDDLMRALSECIEKKGKIEVFMTGVKKISEGQWEVNLTKLGRELVFRGRIELRLQVDYCWYRGIISAKTGNVIFKPIWYPKSGTTAVGVWNLGNNKCLSSVIIK